jgi:hypothetical protein
LVGVACLAVVVSVVILVSDPVSVVEDVKSFVLALIGKAGRSMLKKTYDYLLEQHKEYLEKYYDYVILTLLILVYSEYRRDENIYNKEIDEYGDEITIDEEDRLEEKIKEISKKEMPKRDVQEEIVEAIYKMVPNAESKKIIIELDGSGNKEDFIEFYTRPDVRDVMKLITDKGKQLLKRVFNSLLDDYKEEFKKKEEMYITYLLEQVLHKHYSAGSAEEAENLADELADIIEKEYPLDDINQVDEIELFIAKALKVKPRVYDAEAESFGDIPKSEGRRARGKGKRGGAGSTGNWINFYTDEDVKEVLKHINPTGKKRLKSAYNELLEKFLEESVNEYSSLAEIGFIGDECITALLLYPLLKYYLVGEKTQEIKSLINKYKKMIEDECDDESEQTDEFKKVINKHLSKPKHIIIDLEGEGKKGGKKKIGHKKKKPTFTEI